MSLDGNVGNATFYEVKSLEGLSVREFEDKVRDKNNEYIGLVDRSGKVFLAGTSYQNGHVAIPTKHPEFSESVGLTHNHPANANRLIGATLSPADVQNMASLKHNFVRACASGPNENTYILRAKKGARHDYIRLHEYAKKSEKKVDKIMRTEYGKAERKLTSKGKKLPKYRKNQIVLGSAKKVWKADEVKKAGFEYIEIKKKI